MSDFNSISTFVKCDNFKVGGYLWPIDYNVNDAYLKFSNENGLTWEKSSTSIINRDIGFNDYIIMNNVQGGDNINLSANTNSYLRAGPGERFGGPDGKGTGLTYDPRGQITIGLTHKDADGDSTDISIHGSSLKQHSSITDKQLNITGDKIKLQYPSKGEKLFQESPLNFKIINGITLNKENGQWINKNYKSECLTNKVLNNPHISGDIIFPKGKSNVEYGVNSGNIGVISGRKEIPGIFNHHKGINENASTEENYYKNWTIETTVNNKKESNIIEEYNVGYQKLYGTFKDYNNPVDGEHTFKDNNYYNGWNLSVSAYTIYNTNFNSQHLIRPGTVFKIIKGNETHYEILTQVCKVDAYTLFFENSYENYDGGIISIEGFATGTEIKEGAGSDTITINPATTSFIPAKTNVILTDTTNNTVVTRVIVNDIEAGETSIILSDNSPDSSNVISIKPFNSSETTIAKVNYSERIINYTITNGPIQPGTSISSNINSSSTSIDINHPILGNINAGEVLEIGGQQYKVITDTHINSLRIDVSYNGTTEDEFVLPSGQLVYFKSFTGETIVCNDDYRNIGGKNNTIKTLSKQDVDSIFYISPQNKEHENGIIYGNRIGKLLSNRKLNIYHREHEGFYVGWFIYLWNTQIPLNNNLLSDIKEGTVLSFTNPLDDTDTLDLILNKDSTTSSSNINISVSSIPGKNLDGFKVTIKGFPSETTISSHITGVPQHNINIESELIGLNPQIGDIIINSENANTYIYNGGSTGTLSDYTLLSSPYIHITRVALSHGVINDAILPDFTRIIVNKTNETTKFYKVCAYDDSSKQLTIISDSLIDDLSGYTVKIHAIPDNTIVSLPSGIIEGYNSRLNTIQVLSDKETFSIDDNTFYCLKKGGGGTSVDEDIHYVNLDGNKILSDNYYNNWKIEVESEKNKGYYESSSDYIINDYKKQKHITDYETEHSGIIINSSSLPMMVNPIGKDYFKGWTIGITSETITDEEGNTGPNFSSVTTVRGSIISHDESTQDDTIPDNTLITNVVSDHQGPNGMYVSIITISPPLSSALPTNTDILITDINGDTRKLTVYEMNSGLDQITLTTYQSYQFIGGAVFMLTDISSLEVLWDNSEPELTSATNYFYITYNKLEWNTTNQRPLLYKTLKAKHISSDSSENNSNRLSGILSIPGGETTGNTNQVKLLSNLDTGTLTDNVDVLRTDFSPPSTIDNYYKDWNITLNISSSHETFTIIKYSGIDNIITLDRTITQNIYESFTPYILTKNLKHQEVIDDIFNISTYVSNIYTNNSFGALPSNTTITNEISNSTTLINISQKTTTSIQVGTILEIGDHNFTVNSNTSNDSTIINVTYVGDDIFTIPSNTNIYINNDSLLILNNNTKKTSIDDFRTILLSPPRVFKSRTTINSLSNNGGTTYITVDLNSDMDSLITYGVEIELISKDNTYKTTVFEDAVLLNQLKLTYTSEIDAIGTGNTEEDYTINVFGENTNVPIKAINNNSVALPSNTTITNEISNSTTLIYISQQTTTSIQVGTILEIGGYLYTVSTSNIPTNSNEISVIYTGSDTFTISANTKIYVKSTVRLETKPYYNVMGWYISLYNDRKYKIYYDNYSGQGGLASSGKGFELWNTLSDVNDFYQNWTLQIEEYFDQVNESAFVTPGAIHPLWKNTEGDNIEETFTKRLTLNIEEYNGTNKEIIRNVGYTQEIRDLYDILGITELNFSKFAFYLIPSKNVKYGGNFNNPTTNTTEYKLISNHTTDKNKLIESGIMQKENTISPFSSEINDYYNGWLITTYNTITSNNDKLIFEFNESEKVISMKHGSYSGHELATELKNKLNSAIGEISFTVLFSELTQKITISAPSTFTLKWENTYEHYFTYLHETLGFNKTNVSDNENQITSPNKISLYTSKNGESSIIEKYNGTTKSLVISNLRNQRSTPSISTKIGNKTKYIITPPEHTR